MRIDELRLLAFGPFTDKTLDLSGGNEGFHLVYGPNEAGKSSVLRALRYMLYGIPERSPDNFRHAYNRMRIGSVIRTAHGDSLELIRRKGRGNTLRAADDSTVVDASQLARILSGVDARRFETMLAIGYRDLVRGGRNIIQGGGNLGRLVFSAGSGIANLREIQNELRIDAERLFLPSGKKPKINAALGRLNQYRKEIREAQLPGQEWASHDKALTLALEQKKQVDTKMATRPQALQRLLRIREALPHMARRMELKKAVEAHASAILLPESFAGQRRDRVARLAVAEKEKQQAQRAIAAHRRAIDALEISDAVLDNSDAIEEIYRQLGRQRKDLKDRIRLETMRDTHRREAKDTLRGLRDDLTLEEAEKLRIKKAEIVRIQDLGARYERIFTRIEDARERLPELSRQIRKIEENFATLPMPATHRELRSALARARTAGPLEQQARTEQTEIRSAEQSIRMTRDKLGLRQKSSEDLERLPIPSPETVRAFETRLMAAGQEQDTLHGEIKKIRDELRNVERRMEAQLLEREVPTEDDLKKARRKRDRGLQLISRQMDKKPLPREALSAYLDDSPDSKTLIDAFKAHLLNADAISDRLRREADLVAAKAALLADRAAFSKQRQHLEKEEAQARKKKNAISAEWSALWQPTGIPPRSPAEMEQWVRECITLVESVKALRLKRTKAEELQRSIDTHRLELTQCLQSVAGEAFDTDTTLDQLMEGAVSRIERDDKLRQERERLTLDKDRHVKELAAARSRLEANEQALRQWQGQWEVAVRPIGLEAQSLPTQANAVIEEVKALFDTLKQAEILQKRIAGIDRDTDAFSRKANRLMDLVAPDLTERSGDEAVLEVHRRLKQSRDAESKREEIAKQVARKQKNLGDAEHEIVEIEAVLAGMCEEAGCKTYTELPRAEERSHKRRQIEADLKAVDERLRDLSAGETVDDFVAEAATVDPDNISGDIRRLEEFIEDLDRERSEILKTIGREGNELSKMDGSSRAAALAEEMQHIMGGMENDVEQYARLKIAARVLNRAIERYRDQSQGPILRHASILFNRLTCGSFEEIRAEFDTKGEQVMVGIRAGNGEIVHVDGMSDGTADQLYLALRLAGLELYLEENEPIPFIVDDILIKFDNQRAAAALEALADVSQSTQLIFFTHHRHLVEMAQKNVDAAMLFVHDLGK